MTKFYLSGFPVQQFSLLNSLSSKHFALPILFICPWDLTDLIENAKIHYEKLGFPFIVSNNCKQNESKLL